MKKSHDLQQYAKILCFALLCFSFYACSEKQPNIKGSIKGADKIALSIEKADANGLWIVIDSVKTNSKGDFSIKIPRQQSPEIMRLGLGEKYIYFPVDSTETISVNTTLNNFDTDFSLGGSENAKKMELFEKEVINFKDYKDPEKFAAFKKNIYSKYLQDPDAFLLAYYILTKTYNSQPIFNPSDKQDLKYYAAVATAFKQFNPDDPRAQLIEKVALSNMRKRNAESGRQTILQAPTASFIDINLINENNQQSRLSSLVGNGKPTILMFTLMNQPESPAYNAELRELDNATQHRYNIYQVSLDTDVFAWREAAINLPWTTVIDPAANASEALANYNVQRLPTFYIINAQGELTDKAEDFKTLKKLIK